MAALNARGNTTSPTSYPASDQTLSAESLLGREIVDLDGCRIGELHDVVFDLASGKIAYIFIALNQNKYGDQRVLAPWNAFSIDSSARRLRMNTRREPTGAARTAAPLAAKSFAND